jgi:hypothetical protein
MHFPVLIWASIAGLALFIGIGASLLTQSLRRAPGAAPATARRRRVSERIRDYVGPVAPGTALLNPWARVLLEAVGSACGFPGFGWLASTRVAIGLALLIGGGAIVYGFFPVALAVTGHWTDSPLVTLSYLPYLSAVSASCLAIAEFKTSRRPRDAS